MDSATLLARVEELARDGHRLIMINATSLVAKKDEENEGVVEIVWSFEKDAKLTHLTERVAVGDQVPSVSRFYPFAYLYENEMAELFGVDVVGRNVDFKGALYQTSTKMPMSLKAIRARLEAAKAPQGKTP